MIYVKGKSKISEAVILAAGERKDFDKPATFLEIEETTIIERLIRILKKNGINRIIIVVGYENHYFDNLNIKEVELVYSDRFKWTGTMHSLSLVEKYLSDDFLLIEGDLIFEEKAIDYLLEAEDENCLVLVNESGSGDEGLVEIRDESVFRISKDMHQLGKIDGEFIGLSKLSIDTYREMLVDFKYSKNQYLHYEYVLMNINYKNKIGYAKIDDLVWSEVDTAKDYEKLRLHIYPELLKREVEFRERHVKNLFSSIMGDKYKIKAGVEKLGGMNNDNYKIYTDSGELVFRLPGKGSNESVNRESEIFNARVAKEIGINCNTIYFDSKTGLKITEYIEDAETLNLTTARREDNMESMAHVLNILHDSKKSFYRDFQPFIEIEEYKNTIKSEEKRLLEKFKALDESVLFLKGQIEDMDIEYLPCHLDAWPENFVKGIDRTYLIDWEYSANYDRLWDVVSIGLECEYSKDEEELFLKKYFGRNPLYDEIFRMDILRILMDLYWSMWSLAKVSCGENDLYDYSLGRYKRAISNLDKFKNKDK